MADFGKLRRSNLGAPPPKEEASTNLRTPELPPAEPTQAVSPPAPPSPVEQPPAVPVTPSPSPAPTVTPPPVEQPRARRDGRTMRKTNRTVAFATRVSETWDNRIRDIAERDGLMLVEVLERALDAYEKAIRK